jgi:hypothetical protein
VHVSLRWNLSLDFSDHFTPEAKRAARDAGRLLQKPRAREWKSVNNFIYFAVDTKKYIQNRSFATNPLAPILGQSIGGDHHEQRRQLKILMLPPSIGGLNNT